MSINYFNEKYDLLTDLTFCNFACEANEEETDDAESKSLRVIVQTNWMTD